MKAASMQSLVTKYDIVSSDKTDITSPFICNLYFRASVSMCKNAQPAPGWSKQHWTMSCWTGCALLLYIGCCKKRNSSLEYIINMVIVPFSWKPCIYNMSSSLILWIIHNCAHLLIIHNLRTIFSPQQLSKGLGGRGRMAGRTYFFI